MKSFFVETFAERCVGVDTESKKTWKYNLYLLYHNIPDEIIRFFWSFANEYYELPTQHIIFFSLVTFQLVVVPTSRMVKCFNVHLFFNRGNCFYMVFIFSRPPTPQPPYTRLSLSIFFSFVRIEIEINRKEITISKAEDSITNSYNRLSSQSIPLLLQTQTQSFKYKWET